MCFEGRDLRFLEERDGVLSFGRERKLGECLEGLRELVFDKEVLG